MRKQVSESLMSAMANSGSSAHAAVKPSLRLAGWWWPSGQPRSIWHLLGRYLLSLASLVIPGAVSYLFLSHPSLGPIISLSYVIAVCAAAWWGGALAGILVGCGTIPVMTIVVTHGKLIIPPRLDPVGLIVLFFISIQIGRASCRERV